MSELPVSTAFIAVEDKEMHLRCVTDDFPRLTFKTDQISNTPKDDTFFHRLG